MAEEEEMVSHAPVEERELVQQDDEEGQKLQVEVEAAF